MTLLLFLLLLPVYALDNWPELSLQQQVAVRAQRDVSDTIPINQVGGVGVSLNELVFNEHGYSETSLLTVLELLDVNFRTLMVDVYWNNFTSKWQLCPAPFTTNTTNDLSASVDVAWDGHTYSCQPRLTPTDLVKTIYSYLSSTNTNMDINMVLLLLRLKHFDLPSSNSSTKIYTAHSQEFLALGNSSLHSALDPLGSLLFTPDDLDAYDNDPSQGSDQTFYNSSDGAYPSSETFFFTQYKRVIALVVSDESKHSLSSADHSNIFDATDEGVADYNSSTIDLCDRLQSSDTSLKKLNSLALSTDFKYIADSPSDRFTNSSLKDTLRCGYTPILNSSSYEVFNKSSNTLTLGTIINEYIPYTYWSWAPDQPSGVSTESNSNESYSNSNSGNSENQVAYKCVALTESGWKLQNCYNKLLYACQKSESPNEWHIDPDSKTLYFKTDNVDCPSGYLFSVPQLSIEQLSLMLYMAKHNIEYPVWIDMNDITVTDCFVSGGPYAQCPYQRTITKLTLAKKIAPSAIVAIIIIVLVFLEKLFRVNPVQTNRKRHWRRVINEYYKENEYEGVPS